MAVVIVTGALIACLAYNLSHLSQTTAAGTASQERLLAWRHGDSYDRAAESARGERDWLIYGSIRRLFRGWRLIGFDRDSVLFSSMYAMNYTGPAETLVRAYAPDLSPDESASLMARVAVRRERAARPEIGVIAPGPGSIPRTAIALRTSNGTILIVPIDVAPPRFAELADVR